MQSETILPQLDSQVLKDKANEFAMKGAVESIKEFYSGYNSPYRKAIEEELKTKQIGTGIELPDIIAIINDRLTNEIDAIANEAIAKTFVPMVKSFLIREKAELNFSDVLKEFIEKMDSDDYEDFELGMEKEEKYGWYNIELTSKEKTYKLTLHEDYDSRKETVKTYSFLALPYQSSSAYDKKETMKLSVDGATLELPFTRDILKDGFTSYIARLVIAKTKITIDATDFDESMFPEKCYCH